MTKKAATKAITTYANLSENMKALYNEQEIQDGTSNTHITTCTPPTIISESIQAPATLDVSLIKETMKNIENQILNMKKNLANSNTYIECLLSDLENYLPAELTYDIFSTAGRSNSISLSGSKCHSKSACTSAVTRIKNSLSNARTDLDTIQMDCSSATTVLSKTVDMITEKIDKYQTKTDPYKTEINALTTDAITANGMLKDSQLIYKEQLVAVLILSGLCMASIGIIYKSWSSKMAA